MAADYSSTLAGLSAAAAITAIVGAGALKAAPGFARWLTDKVASFFDGGDDEFNDEEHEFWVCDFCGDCQDDECDMYEYEGEVMCGLCNRDDSRWA